MIAREKSLSGARAAHTLLIPEPDVEVMVDAFDRALDAAHFRPAPHPDVPGVVRVYRRGSVLGDVLLNGSGLSLLTKRIGPVSVRGVVVLWRSAPQHGEVRMILSTVIGHEIGADVENVVRDALSGAAARGVRIRDVGSRRAMDIPLASPANPKTAAELGLT